MALQHWGHAQYWQQHGAPAPGSGTTMVSYPKWWPATHQGMPSLFGAFQGWWDWCLAIWRLSRVLRPASPAQIAACEPVVAALWGASAEAHLAAQRVLDVMGSPAYGIARRIVRETATSPKMRDHHHWREVGRIAEARNWGENVCRSLHANDQMERQMNGEWVPARDRVLAVELAYQTYVELGR